MRLLIAIAAASLPLTTSAAAPQAEREPPQRQQPQPGWAQTPQECERAEIHHADDAKPVKPRKLTELPPGNLQLAVHREVDGCPEPVIVRYDFGGGN